MRLMGESPVYVKEQMGHSSIQVTVDLYGHLIPGGNKQAVDRLDDPMKAGGLKAKPHPRRTLLQQEWDRWKRNALKRRRG